MKENLEFKNKNGELIFELEKSALTKVTSEYKGGEHIYLLEYDYVKDFLIINRDVGETLEKLKDYFHIIGEIRQTEKIYVLTSTVLEADMVTMNVEIEYGAILEFDLNGKFIADVLNQEKEDFSAVNADELAELDLESLEVSSKDKPYIDPAEALVQASKEAGARGYERKDVLKKFAEEKEQKRA
ncbi:MAG: hypothetical protein MK132_21470 [Lentisphaerales bacterium]|nr:hypothetical protein [Lentisphaerales bacterium]